MYIGYCLSSDGWGRFGTEQQTANADILCQNEEQLQVSPLTQSPSVIIYKIESLYSNDAIIDMDYLLQVEPM